jgi:phosphoglucomutase
VTNEKGVGNMHQLIERWKTAPLPSYLTEELTQFNETQLEDCFYQDLTFGTGGMRGELGVGINRMNIYTIRKAAYGLAKHVASNGEEAKAQGVVIAYDTRHFSKEFAIETARVLGAQGVKAYVFAKERPTPELSFAVRYLHAYAGVVITASHNPKQYNGFKVYGRDGAQMVPKDVEVIINEMASVKDLFAIEVADFDLHSQWVLEEIDRAYLDHLLQLKMREINNEMKLVYTPLHGAGLEPITQGLKEMGFTNMHIVEEQAKPDGDFSTVPYPNPEDSAAFEMAIALGKEVGADLLLATDPDADRLGVAVRQDNEYVLLTGNQLGALVLEYLLSTKQASGTLPNNGVVLKTIVTAELGTKIAHQYGVEVVNVLTGFKYIAEKIAEYEFTREKQFIFGYEESYGYLVQPFVRDKDAVQLALVTAEMAAYYAQQGKTLFDALESLFQQYGYYKEMLVTKEFLGKSGQEKMQQLLDAYRNNRLNEIAGVEVLCIEDYLTSIATYSDGTTTELDLPKENVLKYILQDGSWMAIRPSGTEPKCKFYIGTTAQNETLANNQLKAIYSSIMKRYK